jgi:hypothetical protein
MIWGGAGAAAGPFFVTDKDGIKYELDYDGTAWVATVVDDYALKMMTWTHSDGRVIQWRSPYTRYFPDQGADTLSVFSDRVYQDGSEIYEAPSFDISCAFVKELGGTEYLIYCSAVSLTIAGNYPVLVIDRWYYAAKTGEVDGLPTYNPAPTQIDQFTYGSTYTTGNLERNINMNPIIPNSDGSKCVTNRKFGKDIDTGKEGWRYIDYDFDWDNWTDWGSFSVIQTVGDSARYEDRYRSELIEDLGGDNWKKTLTIEDEERYGWRDFSDSDVLIYGEWRRVETSDGTRLYDLGAIPESIDEIDTDTVTVTLDGTVIFSASRTQTSHYDDIDTTEFSDVSGATPNAIIHSCYLPTKSIVTRSIFSNDSATDLILSTAIETINYYLDIITHSDVFFNGANAYRFVDTEEFEFTTPNVGQGGSFFDPFLQGNNYAAGETIIESTLYHGSPDIFTSLETVNDLNSSVGALLPTPRGTGNGHVAVLRKDFTDVLSGITCVLDPVGDAFALTGQTDDGTQEFRPLSN